MTDKPTPLAPGEYTVELADPEGERRVTLRLTVGVNRSEALMVHADGYADDTGNALAMLNLYNGELAAFLWSKRENGGEYTHRVSLEGARATHARPPRGGPALCGDTEGPSEADIIRVTCPTCYDLHELRG